MKIQDLNTLENLSYDEASNITGGTVADLIRETLNFAQEAVNQGFATAQQAVDGAFTVIIETVRACAASSDPASCLDELDFEI
ncbi:MAG: hypothetical protein AB4372_22910 [Xenococcus sp. (in: cyanobacteria)]